MIATEVIVEDLIYALTDLLEDERMEDNPDESVIENIEDALDEVEYYAKQYSEQMEMDFFMTNSFTYDPKEYALYCAGI